MKLQNVGRVVARYEIKTCKKAFGDLCRPLLLMGKKLDQDAADALAEEMMMEIQ